jgi:hypothetical protein
LNADSHIVLKMCKNHVFQLLKVFCVNYISHTEIHSAGALCVRVEVAIEKLIRYD